MAEEPHLKGDEHAWVGMKKIAPDAKEFEANGRRYRVVSSLTVSRYEDFELFQLEVGIGRSFEAIQQSINHAYRLCNRVVKGEEVFAELAILLRDMSIGASLAGTHTPHAVLKMCALFLVRDDEDLSRCPNELIEDKINDWREAGIDMGYFFTFALLTIPGFLQAYRSASRATSSAKVVESEQGAPSTSNSALNE
jgi:hypothetical protein